MVEERVRYTGIMLGSARIVPQPPNTTLQRGLGDCKDQARLLVDLLSALDIPAHIALVRIGSEKGLSTEMAGIERFDHAVVYVPGDDPRWIDPTSPYIPADVIPGHLQGLSALIIAPGSQALTEIPFSDPADNHLVDNWSISMPYKGQGDVALVSEASGELAVQWRESIDQRGGGDAIAVLRESFANLEPTEPPEVSSPAPRDLQQPWRRTARANGVITVFSNGIQGNVYPGSFNGFAWLPPSLSLDNARFWDALPIEHPIQFIPYTAEMSISIAHPPEFAPDLKQGTERWSAGDVTLRQEIEDDGETLTIKIVFDTGDGKLSIQDAKDLRDILRDFTPWPETGISFVHLGWAQLQTGDLRSAMPTFRQSIADYPDDTARRLALVQVLMLSGMMESAQQALRPLLKTEDVSVRFMEANLLSHDDTGRKLRGDFDRAGALDATDAGLSLIHI